MVSLPITSILAAVLAVLLVALSVPVSLRRAKTKALIGDAGDETLIRRIRTQGNFIEYVPLGLLVIALVELSGASSTTVWSLAAALVVGRLLHAAGMLTNSLAMRGIGMILTYLSMLAGAFLLVMAFV